MHTKRSNEPKLSELKTPLLVFMQSYNKSIPEGFPHPSIKMLKVFQELHPTLFKQNDEWSIDKHRKRLMDWLPSYKAERAREKSV